MKTRKGIAAVLAGVMALAALPFSALSAGAESAYAPGDVDMDGYITAHDAAVVSRALYVDETALNDEQKQLADVNATALSIRRTQTGSTSIRNTSWALLTKKRVYEFHDAVLSDVLYCPKGRRLS